MVYEKLSLLQSSLLQHTIFYAQSVCVTKEIFVFVLYFTVGMVKQPTSEQSEFQMSNEDFPALPGTQISDGLMNQQSTNGAQQQQPNNSNTNQLSSGSNMANNVVMNMMAGGHGMMNMDGSMMDKGPAGAGGMDLAQGDSSLHDKLKRGVQTHPDGNYFNSIIIDYRSTKIFGLIL